MRWSPSSAAPGRTRRWPSAHWPSSRRGSIVDRNELELAVSEDAVTVFAYPYLIDNPARVSARVAPLLGVSEDDLLKNIVSEGEPALCGPCGE